MVQNFGIENQQIFPSKDYAITEAASLGTPQDHISWHCI
jgi:hypothetical protein